MRKAKNIYFLLIKKKTRWPKAGGGLRQGTFLYKLSIYPCSNKISNELKLYKGQRVQQRFNKLDFYFT